jgi:hypothetical protein
VGSLVLEKLQEKGVMAGEWGPILTQLQAVRRQVLAQNIYLLSRLRSFHAALRKGGIPSIVLKGGCLLSVLYSDFGLRPLGDIDILVRKTDLDRVLDLLAREEWAIPNEKQVRFWKRHFYHLFVTSRDSFSAVLEIHWDLEKEHRHSIQLEELWERSVIFHLEGESFRRLSNEDLIIHLMIHLAHHYYNPRLIWVWDIRSLAEAASIDWNRVLARAERWRLRVPVSYTLDYVEKVFPGAIPQNILEAGKITGIRHSILKMTATPDPLHLTIPMGKSLFRLPFSLYFIEKPGDIFRFLGRNLVPKIWEWMYPSGRDSA